MNKKILIVSLGMFIILALSVVSAEKISVSQGQTVPTIVKYTGEEALTYGVPSIDSGQICFPIKDSKKTPTIDYIYKELDKALKKETKDQTKLTKSKDTKGEDAYCTSYSDFIQVGDHSIVVINQPQKSVNFEYGNSNITATLYKNIDGTFTNQVNDVWVRFNSDNWKFGADDNFADNFSQYKYKIQSFSPIQKIGSSYFVREGIGGYKIDTSDICSWYDENLNQSAECSFNLSSTPITQGVGEFQITQNLNTLEVTFYSNGTIDPSYSYTALDTNSILTNTTYEPNNYTHLSISSTPPYNSLVGYWGADICQGSTVYDLTNNNDGTLAGNANCSGQQLYGNSYGGDGNGGYATVPTSSTLNLSGLSAFSVSVWVKNNQATSESQYQRAITIHDTSTSLVWSQSGNYSRSFAVRTGVSTYPKVQATSALDANKWYMMTGVFNGTALQLYINGVLNATTTISPATVYPNSGESWIGGGSSSPFYYWNGSLDEVMIFNTSLTAQQVSDIYNNQSARFKPSGTITFKQNNITTGNDRLNLSFPSIINYSNSNVQARIGTWNISNGYNDTGSNLVAYYHFDNSFNDSSGNNNNGVAQDGANLNGAGIWNNSLGLDGNGDYMIVPHNERLDNLSADNEVTVTLWVKDTAVTTATSYASYFRKRQNTDGFDFGRINNILYFSYGNGTSFNDLQQSGASNFVQNNQWFMFSFTGNSSGGFAYINGNLIKNSSFVGKFTYTNIQDIWIGYRSGIYLNGSVDEVIILNRSLSASEIKELYVKGRANFQYSPFQNVSGSNSSNVFNISSADTNVIVESKLLSNSYNYPTSYVGMSYNYNTFISDNIAPSVQILDGSGGLQVRQSDLPYTQTIHLNITDNTGLGSTNYTVLLSSGQTYQNSTSFNQNISISLSSFDTYTFIVKSYDSAGNLNQTTFTLQISQLIDTPSNPGSLANVVNNIINNTVGGNETIIGNIGQSAVNGIATFINWLNSNPPIFFIGILLLFVFGAMATGKVKKNKYLFKSDVRMENKKDDLNY